MAFSEAQLQEIIKAITSTNLGLQNSLGIYATQAQKAIDIIGADLARSARLGRIENDLSNLVETLNTVLDLRAIELKAKSINRKKKRNKK